MMKSSYLIKIKKIKEYFAIREIKEEMKKKMINEKKFYIIL